MIRLESFRAVGGYDESFPQNEDAELDHRLANSGYKIWLTSQTSLTYYPRSSPSRLFRQYMGYGHGRARSIMKHRIRPRLRQFLPATVLPMMLLAVATPIVKWACLPISLWLALCIIYSGALARGARSISFALIALAALLMHTGWSLGFWQAVLTKPWKD